jgi:hypothetical protein
MHEHVGAAANIQLFTVIRTFSNLRAATVVSNSGYTLYFGRVLPATKSAVCETTGKSRTVLRYGI